MTDDRTARDMRQDGSPAGVFAVFLRLGLTSFGGPIAHLGYFRTEFVARRKWIDDRGYADLVALCQFLPGPASSQVGFALGLLRAGPLGALAAFLGFTLPSALALIAFGYGAHAMGGPLGAGVIAGLKVVAVAIVAQAVLGMARSLCPDRTRAAIAFGAVVVVTLLAGAAGQVAAIAAGALAGLILCRGPAEGGAARLVFPVTRGAGAACLALFTLLLVGLPLLTAALPAQGPAQGIALFDAFYRAGSLVFGGGHVVLPLLEAEMVRPGWVAPESFLAGYGAAQAVPGPLFTFAAYLGTVTGGLSGAAIALVAVFLPGFLLLVGAIPFWDALRARPGAQALMRGANAAVVGILGAALYDPVFTGAVTGPGAFALALGCFLLLALWKAPPWAVVVVAALGGVAAGA